MVPRQASIKVGEFVETLTNRTVTKQQEKPMFKKLMMLLKTDNGCHARCVRLCRCHSNN